MTYQGISGKRYVLESELARGGEGIVYSIHGDSSIVAKIYLPNKFKSFDERRFMENKLKAMLSIKLPVYVDNILRLAWPLDILYDNGSMVGFLMPRMNQMIKIYDIQRCNRDEQPIKPWTRSVLNVYPNFTWKYAVQFAYNLAWVVNYVHQNNIIVGDLNQSNIYADTKTGAVVLIDCDSFDITDPNTGIHYPCTVGFQELLAPELQTVINLSNAKFTKESDQFSLAIHIFRLLMMNEDPFRAKMTTDVSLSSLPVNSAIINGECVFVRTVPNKVLPPDCLKLDFLPDTVQELFKRTFDYTSITAQKRISKRPTALEWCHALAPYAAAEPNTLLQHCTINAFHVYPAKESICPWCAKLGKIKQFGSLVFPDGSTYEGEYVNLLPHGKGKMTWTNGNTYEGTFVNGIRTGTGTYRWANGNTYKGEFFNNQCHGHGKLIDANGRVTEGTWINDQRQLTPTEQQFSDASRKDDGLLMSSCILATIIFSIVTGIIFIYFRENLTLFAILVTLFLNCIIVVLALINSTIARYLTLAIAFNLLITLKATGLSSMLPKVILIPGYQLIFSAIYWMLFSLLIWVNGLGHFFTTSNPGEVNYIESVLEEIQPFVVIIGWLIVLLLPVPILFPSSNAFLVILLVASLILLAYKLYDFLFMNDEYWLFVILAGFASFCTGVSLYQYTWSHYLLYFLYLIIFETLPLYMM